MGLVRISISLQPKEAKTAKAIAAQYYRGNMSAFFASLIPKAQKRFRGGRISDRQPLPARARRTDGKHGGRQLCRSPRSSDKSEWGT